MPIATCPGQFHSQKLWLKSNVVLIVHDSEPFMLTATVNTSQKDSSTAKPCHAT